MGYRSGVVIAMAWVTAVAWVQSLTWGFPTCHRYGPRKGKKKTNSHEALSQESNVKPVGLDACSTWGAVEREIDLTA